MYKLLFLLISLNVFTQTENIKNFDVRNVVWGMSVEEVMQAEKNKHIILIDTVNYVDEINKVLLVSSLIINNTETELFYEFRNNQLIRVVYHFNKQDTSQLYKRVFELNRVYNSLVSNKRMNILYCWSYGNESYKRLSGKNACEFNNQQDIENLESLAKDQVHIQEAIFSLNNRRTIASFIFNLKENRSVSKLQFIPSPEVKKEIIDQSF